MIPRSSTAAAQLAQAASLYHAAKLESLRKRKDAES